MNCSMMERFMRHVKRTPECWEWQGATGGTGYGEFCVKGALMAAHRVSWELHNGVIPEGSLVLHKCDNRRCVNPVHLFLGSQSDNMLDASRKGRHHCTRKTHCPHGHPYSDENTYRRNGGRDCRECHRIRSVELRARRRARSLRDAAGEGT
jgi:hypothetical protein